MCRPVKRTYNEIPECVQDTIETFPKTKGISELQTHPRAKFAQIKHPQICYPPAGDDCRFGLLKPGCADSGDPPSVWENRNPRQ